MNSRNVKKAIENILMVDSIDGILLNYQPKNFKEGDKIICVVPMENNYVNERIIIGQEYEVGWYDKGNPYKKGYLQIKGCRVLWDDDHFELAVQNVTIDINYTDITNQKMLK